MPTLWTPEEIAEATGAPLPQGAGPVLGVSIDSRTLEPGDLFVAIRGDTHDGHAHVAAALEAGAAGALVDRAGLATLGAVAGPLYVVEETLAGLCDLARAARARSQGKIVAVTGSVGKTGTKEALRTVLSHAGETHASDKSYNNHWGVPLSLARLPKKAAFGVFEIGMNHAGEITPLVALVRPHAAIVTTVQPVHLEFFDGLAGIAEAKAEIFSGLVEEGVAVINGDIEFAGLLAERARAAGAGQVLTFGEGANNDAVLKRVALLPDCSTAEAVIDGVAVAFKVGMPGRHVVLNALAVLTTVKALGVDLARAALALATLTAPEGRGRRIELATHGEPILLIDESYNANPASMRAALDVLAAAPTGLRGRRIAVLGDMLELGAESAAFHAGLAEPISTAGVDRAYLAGESMRFLWRALPAAIRGAHTLRSAELVDALLGELAPGDVVVVKGSAGSRMGLIVEALRARYAKPSGSPN
ncbi:MAG: UDP-N-acetylmuramoylalanyl-D-glutamyl-2,6-diaminopimelate--D-alanyl-D-alanine ligase [Hyphomicrobiaceae bacterium]|nr:UDP-N-acetylmuramoylalanyl-D-glutamyl-2,6-diaminopimelate--D-alanyl-D-alanine ligase [Hyphomicrobiaceae bacterium]